MAEGAAKNQNNRYELEEILEPSRLHEVTPHYSPVTNACYVRMLIYSSLADVVRLYDAQTRQKLAEAQERAGLDGFRHGQITGDGPPTPLLFDRAALRDAQQSCSHERPDKLSDCRQWVRAWHYIDAVMDDVLYDADLWK